MFEIGHFPIRAYGLVVAIAILLSIGLAYSLAKGTKYQKHITDLGFYVVLGAIIGARLWEVLFFERAYYSQHIGEIFMIWMGGLSIQGGLVGGFITGAIYTWYHKLHFWEFADVVAPAIVFGQGVGRIACFLNGDAFGSPTGGDFGIVYPPGTIANDVYGSQPLYPAEVWEGQMDFVIFGLLLILRSRRWFQGFYFLSYNILYSLGRFLLEILRGDTPRYMFNWTAAQWTSISVIVVSLILMVYLSSKKTSYESQIS